MMQDNANPSPDPPIETALAPPEPAADGRTQPDRRQSPTSVWGSFPPAGRRMRQRRADEHRRAYFVDRFPPMLFAFLLMLLLASIVDGLLTLRLIEAGGEEVNPLMARLLNFGVFPFLLGKYLLTAVGLPLLVIFKNHYVFGTRIRVGYLIPGLVALYAILICYQLVLMQQV
jgi:hypothetical protein